MLDKSIKQFSAIAAIIAGYLYTSVFLFSEYNNVTIQFLLFASLLTAWVLVVNKNRVKESWIWFVTFWCNITAFAYLMNSYILSFSMVRVWGNSIFILLFIHCYCVYWIMSVSNGLIKSVSSKYFLIDCIYGAFIIPISNIFLLAGDIVSMVKTEKSEKRDYTQYVYLFIALIIAIVLFTFSVSLLSSVNEQFKNLFEGFLKLMSFEEFNLDSISQIVIRTLFSMPVASYLYGLIIGVGQNNEERKILVAEKIENVLKSIQRIPAMFWNITLGFFNVMYIIFMVLQFNYLFGIIVSGSVAEGYTIAEYARSGFFELCKVMAINFLLLWIVIKSNADNKVNKTLAIGLMLESILLALTDFSKIYFYITIYGFTPLRYQSIWFTTVLMVGCICVIYYLLRNKDCSRIWILFTGITLAITILI